VKRLGDLAEETETRIPEVRSEIAERLVKELGMSLAGTARLLGASTSAISEILHRIAHESSE
jgi:predicted transcriptional regulator